MRITRRMNDLARGPSLRKRSADSFVRALARRARLRPAFELGGDWLRFRIDYATAPHYQPLPWRESSSQSARRVEGVLSRWKAMLPVIEELGPESALDIGCHAGWFTLNLAALKIPTVGLESFPPYYRTAIYAAKRARAENVAIMAMELNERTSRLMPNVDCTLCLAVWHHLVQQYGIDEATELLCEVWRHTAKVLFFESGEREMGPAFGLPELKPDARIWFTDYLDQTCPGATIRHLGLHHAGNGGNRIAWRNLFALVRETNESE
jgi:SAM-dependent methyltransferase